MVVDARMSLVGVTVSDAQPVAVFCAAPYVDVTVAQFCTTVPGARVAPESSRSENNVGFWTCHAPPIGMAPVKSYFSPVMYAAPPGSAAGALVWSVSVVPGPNVPSRCHTPGFVRGFFFTEYEIVTCRP